MRKSMRISGTGKGGMDVSSVAGGTQMLCDLLSVGYSAVVAGDTVLMTFDGPPLLVETILKSQLLTAADFEMEAEEIYEN